MPFLAQSWQLFFCDVAAGASARQGDLLQEALVQGCGSVFNRGGFPSTRLRLAKQPESARPVAQREPLTSKLDLKLTSVVGPIHNVLGQPFRPVPARLRALVHDAHGHGAAEL
jgi:hypothetical protein